MFPEFVGLVLVVAGLFFLGAGIWCLRLKDDRVSGLDNNMWAFLCFVTAVVFESLSRLWIN